MRPLIYTAQAWRDVKEWYVDDDYDDEPVECEGCGIELDPHVDPFHDGLCVDCARVYQAEVVGDDCMAEDLARAIDDLNGLYPHHFDHDQRYDDLYSLRTELPDGDEPPF